MTTELQPPTSPTPAPEPGLVPPGGTRGPVTAGPPDAQPTQPPALAWGVRPPMTQADLDISEHGNSRSLSLAALILCIIPIPITLIAGIVMAVIVLIRGRRRAGRGFALAIGALAVAAVWVILSVCAVLFLRTSTFSTADRSNGSTGEVVKGGAMSPILLQVTDCLDVPAEGEVLSVRAKPCSEPHDGEVYSSPALTEGAFPGEEAVVAEAERLCAQEFPGYVGVEYDDSSLEMLYLYPLDAAQWDAAPRATCIVQSPESLTGTMRLAKR